MVTVSPVAGTSARSRAWYSASFADFFAAAPDYVLGKIVASCDFSVLPTQRDAWLSQITFVQTALAGLNGTIYFEFNIPRMGKRIDAVLVMGAAIFVVEFKVGDSTFSRAAREQVWDYALDLKNFHEGSHALAIIPILIATEADTSPKIAYEMDADLVYRPILTTSSGFRSTLESALKGIGGATVVAETWADSPYKPTPTIVEAACALYAQHSVDAIARHDAGARNLSVTSRRIEELVDKARSSQQKVICLVTGVPGAGKTLVGLNVATHRRDKHAPTHAVFLSGNGPLVKVLLEALARDEISRRKEAGETVNKGLVRASIKSFIQNIHHFRDEGLRDPRPPHDHVVIFDEAQRAWTLEKTADFMARKKKRPGFSQSEPEFLVSYLDRHADWAAVICLVGGGQEINTGEAGISAWIEAMLKTFPDWHLHMSSRLTDSEYGAGHVLELVQNRPNTHLDDSLHLAVSMRSFRAETVSSFVKAILDLEEEQARSLVREMTERYPIAITRDLSLAKEWVRARARGSERFGLVASSKAQRLKPHAIDIRVDINPIHWFLNEKDDTRSSFFLEDAATEFQVQGLELDWTCVTWDADMRHTQSGWTFHDFRGKRWMNIKSPENRAYLKNAYRVLLTRARQGMVIFVPPGDSADSTRRPDYYDSTYDYLKRVGLAEL